MNSQELKTGYNQFIGDEDFDQLELGLREPNLFEVLKISKTEIRHSNLLSWLLNPNGNHGLDDLFLKRFLREIFSSDKIKNIDQIEVNEIDYSSIEIRREWRNIDLLITINDIVICIENKVLSKEHSKQLTRYKNFIDKDFPDFRKVFVYLTPNGEETEEEEDYISISYQSIVNYLERIIKLNSGSMNSSVTTYIKDYVTILKREIMGNDELIELSKRIYKNHKEILDFIYEHKPNYIDHLQFIITECLKKRGYVMGTDNKGTIRFSTVKIFDLTYINKVVKDWRNGESFMFEIVVSENYTNLYFNTTITPSDNNYDTYRLNEFLMEIEGFKQPRGKKWLLPYRKQFSFDYKSINEKTDEELTIEIDKILDKIEPIIQKVEDKFFEHSEELKKMKNNTTGILRSL